MSQNLDEVSLRVRPRSHWDIKIEVSQQCLQVKRPLLPTHTGNGKQTPSLLEQRVIRNRFPSIKFLCKGFSEASPSLIFTGRTMPPKLSFTSFQEPNIWQPKGSTVRFFISEGHGSVLRIEITTLQKLKCANLSTNYEQGRTPPLKNVPECRACQLRL